MVLIHLSFSQGPQLFSHCSSGTSSLSPNYSVPHPFIQFYLWLLLEKQTFAIGATVLLCLIWNTVWTFPCLFFLLWCGEVELYICNVCHAGTPGFSIHCVQAPACMHPHWYLSFINSVILGDSVCSGENGFWSLFHLSWLYLIYVVSGLYLICLDFIWFRWFTNCLLFSIFVLLLALFNYLSWLFLGFLVLKVGQNGNHIFEMINFASHGMPSQSCCYFVRLWLPRAGIPFLAKT